MYAISVTAVLSAIVALVRPVAAHSHPIVLSYTADEVALSTRVYWMRKANEALYDVTGSYCPAYAFGTAIVNHTAGGLGELVCIGANSNGIDGNPTEHGEIAAINNCTDILRNTYGLSISDTLAAFADLSLYTNAESCPMCASAIRWAGFREYIFGSTIDHLIATGWSQIAISSEYIFQQSTALTPATRLLGPFLTNETDPYFGWQYQGDNACPPGCVRSNDTCVNE